MTSKTQGELLLIAKKLKDIVSISPNTRKAARELSDEILALVDQDASDEAILDLRPLWEERMQKIREALVEEGDRRIDYLFKVVG